MANIFIYFFGKYIDLNFYSLAAVWAKENILKGENTGESSR